MVSEQELLEAWSDGKFNPEQAEAILERCLECGDGFLATIVAKEVVMHIMNHWSIEDRKTALGNESTVVKEAIVLGGTYVHEVSEPKDDRTPWEQAVDRTKWRRNGKRTEETD